MASNSRVSILDYFNIVFEGENGKIESNCKACGTRIQAKRTVTSNFVTHLKRKHQAMYDEFVKKKDVKREAYASGTVQTFAGSPGGSSRFSTQSAGAVPKFDRSDPRQTLISEAIAKMIIRDLQAVQIVENEGFRDLLQLLEPRYSPEPCRYIQQQLLPAYAYQVQLSTKQSLTSAESCSVTLDIWKTGAAATAGSSSSGYLGITCHFITTDWQVKSVLLACLSLTGHCVTQRVLSEFDNISHTHGIAGKVFRVVADSAPSRSTSSFRLPGFSLGGEGEDEDEEEEDGSDEVAAGEGKEAARGEEADRSLDQCLGRCRIDCFARSLAACVQEGLRSSPQLSIVLTKAARFYNYVVATVTPEKLGQVFSPGIASSPSTQAKSPPESQWNVQLKTMRRMLESVDFLEDIVDRHDLTLSSFEKTMLRELTDVLEPFEEATDMVQGDKHVSISLALPCVLGLRKHLSETTARQCTGIVAGLAQALDRRLAGILEDPLYVTATTLDPQFKLSWSSDTDWHKQVLLEEVAKHTQAAGPPEPSPDPQPSPSKRSKLFSFIKQRPNTQAKSVDQELATYLHEEPTDEDPLHYWKRKSIDFPLLSQVAKKVFTVPATSTGVERIFGTVGKMLRPERCRLLPKNLETLIYLKANYRILWT
ncbi:zinc finger BED domain-containing protein 4 [Denticeps clupeoides]|uniref:HAT C-terminal dimerisation domain-containing protein n=1 Tax=Denticeps clupeoides TaxID=299321 RepID=A0AAY4EP61_9TELE|nr:zinc finger BED domain-containing protein 4-like [Denticeps clupeoides]